VSVWFLIVSLSEVARMVDISKAVVINLRDLQSLLGSYLVESLSGDKTTVESMAEDFVQMLEFKLDIEHLEEIRSDMESRHQRELSELNAKLSVIKKKCPCKVTKYYPDPSGNNDSCYACIVCGREHKSRPKKS
jgi:rubrerythrin